MEAINMIKTHGIHHVSSIVGHAQRDVDFNAAVLGLRLVKKTLNFDDSSTYHLYYSNDKMNTGITTTFPWTDANEGQTGRGLVSRITYEIPVGTSLFWKERLKSFNFVVNEEGDSLVFIEPSGLVIELIEADQGPQNTWEFNGIDKTNAITGIHSLTLLSKDIDSTGHLLTDILGYRKVLEDENEMTFKVHDELGGLLKIDKTIKAKGQYGTGTVHHLALKVNDDEIEAWFDKLKDAGYRPTPIRNRKYFHSIYFREKGDILIELATRGPGFLIDEDEKSLGTTLQIPPHFKEVDVSDLMPIEVTEVSELKDYGYRNRYEYEIVTNKRKIVNEINSLKAKGSLSESDQLKLDELRQEFIKLK